MPPASSAARASADTFPRLVKNLEIAPGSNRDRIRVRGPDGRIAELYLIEWQLAQQMDGSRSIEALAQGSGRLGVAATPTQIASLVRQLAAYALLEDSAPRQAVAQPFTPEEIDELDIPIAEPTLGPVLLPPASDAPEDAMSELEAIPVGEEGLSAPGAPEEAAGELGVDEWSELQARRARFRRRILIQGGIAGVVVLLLAIVPYPLRLTEQAELRPATRGWIRATLPGLIAEMKVREGSRVSEGQVIAVLDNRELRARLGTLDADANRVDAELAKLRNGNRPEEIRRQEEVVAQRKTALNFARRSLSRTKGLHQNRLASTEQLEEARLDVSVKQRELDNALAELELVRAGSRSEDIRAKEAELERIRAELAFVRSELERTELKSPIDGLLITPRLEEQLGKAVMAGDLVAEVAQLDAMKVDILVPEGENDILEVGQPVSLKVKSFPDRVFAGKVEFISPVTTYVEKLNLNAVRVVASVDNPEFILKDQMTGWAEIECGERSVLSLMFRRVFRWLRVRFVF